MRRSYPSVPDISENIYYSLFINKLHHRCTAEQLMFPAGLHSYTLSSEEEKLRSLKWLPHTHTQTHIQSSTFTSGRYTKIPSFKTVCHFFPFASLCFFLFVPETFHQLHSLATTSRGLQGRSGRMKGDSH